MDISVIIPALNEAARLGETLESLKGTPAEIIVVDGGSHDSTVSVARQYTPHVFRSPRGRGTQQDAGAQRSQGKVLVFLHADTRLPQGYETLIDEAFADPGVTFGAFRLKIHPSSKALELIALMANFRSRALNCPYGDQGLFVRRTAYFQVGGFRHWPIMEDVDLVRRLSRTGRFKLARGAVQTSARRWQREHYAFTTARNWMLMIRYKLGHSPHDLARHYPHKT
jgi:rSAM/selenodomain-associated transferase 2